MSRVRHVLTLAPTTVDRAEEVAREQAIQRRIAYRERQSRRMRQWHAERRTSGVTTSTVVKEMWTTALDLADGEVGRIEIVSAFEVIVHNRPRRSS